MKTNRRTMSALAAGALALGGCSAIDDFGKFTRGDATDAGSLDAGSLDAFMNAPDVFVPEGVDANLPDAFVPPDVFVPTDVYVPPGIDACFAEVCNGADDDCDGALDDGFTCVAGGTTSCTTSCGSTGTQACSAACEPTGACSLPSETCNASDDDCDTLVDEGVTTFGARIDLGSARRRFEVLPRAGGYVAIWGTTSGIFGQLLDESGATVGSAVTLVSSSADFGAAIEGTTLYLVTTGTNLTGYRFATTDLSTIGTSTSLAISSPPAFSRVRLVSLSTGLVVAYSYTSGSAYAFRTLSCTTSFACGSPVIQLWTSSAPDLELIESARGVAILGAGGPFGGAVGGALVSPVGETAYVINETSGEDHDVQLAEGVAPDGGAVLGVLYRHDDTASALRFVLFDVATDGTPTPRDTIDLMASAPVASTSPSSLDLTFSNGHFVASWFAGTTSSSTWHLADISAPSSGPPVATDMTVEGSAAANGAVSLAPSGANLLVAASRTSAIARGYLRGCH